jgi:NAD(P)-dependent dehydrogenase (short-subunit alcohol dehydrogenase family)
VSESKTVLVTGAASGIGKAAALLFARDGWRVVCADLDETAAGATAKECGDAIGVGVDVSNDVSVGAMVAAALDRYGRLDAAFNNAGIAPQAKPFTDHTLHEWQRVIDVDLTGVFLCMQHELRHMVEHGGGAIVNTSSGAGQVPAPGQPQYTAAKHAVIGLTKHAAQEYARKGIRVNAILPGMTDTPPLRAYLEANPGMERMLPMGRLATPAEVAEAAVWLCSDAAAYVSGTALVVDGATILR